MPTFALPPAKRHRRAARRLAVPSALAVLAACVALLLFLNRNDGQAGQQAVLLPESDAVGSAVNAALEWGLRGEPAAHAARLLTLREFALYGGDRYTASVGFGDLRPSDRVWAVSLLGDVTRTLPSTGETLEYDNITVVLDAVTGATVLVEAYFDGYESPFRLPAWFDNSQPVPTLPPR